jgi:hypothetical protein
MQPSLIIEATNESPKVVLNPVEGVFLLEGRSLLLDAEAFYQPIIKWLYDYKKSPNESTKFEFKLDYLNTISSKYILPIIALMENTPNSEIEWHFREEQLLDGDIIAEGD